METKWQVMCLLSLATVSNQGSCVAEHAYHFINACFKMFLDNCSYKV